MLFCYNSFSQDTLNLYFKNTKIAWSKDAYKIDVSNDSSEFNERIFDIGENHFLYIKSSTDDSLPVEFGQLGLYTIRNRFYLLREGIWVLKNNSEYVIFTNSGSIGIPEEMTISRNPIWYDGTKNKKRKRKIRTSSKQNHPI